MNSKTNKIKLNQFLKSKFFTPNDDIAATFKNKSGRRTGQAEDKKNNNNSSN